MFSTGKYDHATGLLHKDRSYESLKNVFNTSTINQGGLRWTDDLIKDQNIGQFS